MSKRLDLLTGEWKEEFKGKKKAPENQVGKAVDAYLKSIGAYMRQINSGGTKRNGTWTTSGQGSGISDRVGILHGGRFVAVELKAPGKKKTVTECQVLFLRNIINRGGVACVADSVECVKVALSQTKEELLSTLESCVRTKRCSPASDLPEWLR